jgi:hypothetical protein
MVDGPKRSGNRSSSFALEQVDPIVVVAQRPNGKADTLSEQTKNPDGAEQY